MTILPLELSIIFLWKYILVGQLTKLAGRWVTSSVAKKFFFGAKGLSDQKGPCTPIGPYLEHNCGWKSHTSSEWFFEKKNYFCHIWKSYPVWWYPPGTHLKKISTKLCFYIFSSMKSGNSVIGYFFRHAQCLTFDKATLLYCNNINILYKMVS